MKRLQLLTIILATAFVASCGTTGSTQGGSSSRAAKREATRSKVAQLREGMSQAQVERIFGRPNKVDHDDGYHRGAYIPYYGWRGSGIGEPELEWEYDRHDLTVTFRRGRSGAWVVKEWDAD